MKLLFTIQEQYLIAHTMESSSRYNILPFSQWKTLESRLMKKYGSSAAYFFLDTAKHSPWAISELWVDVATHTNSITSTFSSIASDLKNIQRDISQSKEFIRLLKETASYLQSIKKQWVDNEKTVLSFIEHASGITLPKTRVSVIITHPRLPNGMAVIKHNAIVWGHNEDWQNYATVYICHELMHILTWNQQRDYKIMHALIELMTDNELRIRLNGGGEYFTENGKDIGHKNLRELEQKILPIWKDYLAGKLRAKNIFELEKYIIKKGIA